MPGTGNSTQDDITGLLTEDEIANLRDKFECDLFSEEEIAATFSDEADLLSDEDKGILDEQLRQIKSYLQLQEEEEEEEEEKDESTPLHRHTMGGRTRNRTLSSRRPLTNRRSLTSRSQSSPPSIQDRWEGLKSYIHMASEHTWALLIRNTEFARQWSSLKTTYSVLAKEHERTKREFSEAQQVEEDLKNEIKAEIIHVNQQLRALQQQLQIKFIEASHSEDGDESLAIDGIQFAPAWEETIIDQAHLAEQMQPLHTFLDPLTSIIAESNLIPTAATLTVDYIRQYLCHLVNDYDLRIIELSDLEATINISTHTLTGINTADDLTPNLIGNYVDQHFDRQQYEQWLCTATGVNSPFPTINLGGLHLNPDQQAHLTQLCQAFIRSKMPSQQLMACGEQNGNRLELPIVAVCQQHCQHMAEAIHTAISERSETSRFRKLMGDGLPQSIGMITIEGEIHTLIADLVTEYTINYIKTILENESDKLSRIDFDKMRRDLPNKLIGRAQITSDVFLEEFGIPKGKLKKVFNANQRNHILILLQTVQPKLWQTSSPQDIEALATKIREVINTTTYNIHLISPRCRNAMKGLPAEILALQHVKQVQQDVQLQGQRDVTLYDPTFAAALQEQQLQQWWQTNILTIRDEEQRNAYINHLIATKWLTKNQILALSEHMPIFAKDSQKQKLENIREKFYELKSLYLPEAGITEQQIEKIKTFCQGCRDSSTTEVQQAFTTTSQGQGGNVLDRIEELQLRRTDLQQAQQRTATARSKLEETKEKMQGLTKIAVMWKNLAMASAHQYVLQSTSSFHGSEGRERAANVINLLKRIPDDPRTIFRILNELLQSHVVTFNGGSLGSYMLQGLSQAMITTGSTKDVLSKTQEKHNKLKSRGPTTTSIAALAEELKEEEEDLTAETIRDRLGSSSMFTNRTGRPSGETSLTELICNSRHLGQWWRTSDHIAKKHQANALHRQLSQLTYRSQTPN